MELENIDLFITNFLYEQFGIIMSNKYNYIKRNFKRIKFSERKLLKINKLMEEITEINKIKFLRYSRIT